MKCKLCCSVFTKGDNLPFRTRKTSNHKPNRQKLFSASGLNYNPTMSDVTRILSQIEAGDPSASENLLRLVYDELRKLAFEMPGRRIGDRVSA